MNRNMNAEGLTARGRSPNLNINRWSHSTSSSVGAVETDFLRQLSGNTAHARPVETNTLPKTNTALRSQFSTQQPDSSILNQSPGRSPARVSKTTSRRTSPDASRTVFKKQMSSDHLSNLARTPDLENSLYGSASHDYFNTAILDHSRGANKYGQPIEGIALQLSSNHTRQKRSDQYNRGNGLYQGTNSSHISLQKKPSHGKRRDRSTNGSKDTATGGSMSSIRSEHSRRGGHRSPTQKNMLSQALSKANQAVLLDNASDVQGAIAAYNEACEILQQVMVRSNDPDDRRKLSAIRETYSTRISELYDMDNSFDYLHNTDKELPEAPLTTRYLQGQDRISFEDPEDIDSELDAETAESQRLVHIPPRQESLLPSIFGGEQYLEEQQPAGLRPRLPQMQTQNLNVPMDAKFMPQPLSPRRPLSPSQDQEDTPLTAVPHISDRPTNLEHHVSTGSTSWLDTAGDNNSSGTSSRCSSIRRNSRDLALISALEADIDATISASYSDGASAEPTPRPADGSRFDQPHVHHTEADQNHDAIEHFAHSDLHHQIYLDEDAEAEEELLEMIMADGYMDEHDKLPGSMSSLPRQSDSSGFSARSSGRTWESSATAATQGTTLSTLIESPEAPPNQLPYMSDDVDEATLPAQDVDVLARKQASPLPPLPPTEKPATVGLRERRMSGQSAMQLKIETYPRRPSEPQAVGGSLLEVTAGQAKVPELNHSTSNTNISISTLPLTPLTSIHSADSVETPDTALLTQVMSYSATSADGPGLNRSDSRTASRNPPPTTANAISRPRKLSLTTNNLNDLPVTPGSALFPTHSRSGTITTPVVPGHSPNVLSSTAVGGMYVFDHIPDVHSSSRPHSPETFSAEPMSLEPCPESFLLRPFWLMRCLYQTLAHPKGGYISQKLFIPRDIWRVRGVKLKVLDDKIGQCDVLTAALLKLAKVDTLDADAVLEELSSLDVIIDNVKQALTKKLGSDVGITGQVTAMKNSPAGEEPETASKSSSVKSFASSWRKLRSKSSAAVLTPATSSRKDASSEVIMASLPMTGSSGVSTSRSYRGSRLPPPTPTSMPQIPILNANYMSSLARLFDAVQVLDSIARQVEDPGLRATSKTQVGLELSMRGAAEFFSFFIIRFAMADITIMLEKYLKRNGEWVMT